MEYTVENPITKKQIVMSGNVYLKLIKQGIIIENTELKKKYKAKSPSPKKVKSLIQSIEQPKKELVQEQLLEIKEDQTPFYPLPKNKPIFIARLK